MLFSCLSYVRTGITVGFYGNQTLKCSLCAGCLLKNVLCIKTCGKERKEARMGRESQWTAMKSKWQFQPSLWGALESDCDFSIDLVRLG